MGGRSEASEPALPGSAARSAKVGEAPDAGWPAEAPHAAHDPSDDSIDGPAENLTDKPADNLTDDPAHERADDPADDLVDAWTDVVASVADTQDAVLADVYRESGVSAAAFVVLSALRAAEDRRLSMHLLAARLGMTSGGFTKLADRLQAAQLIERRPSAADRRVVLAALTDKGARSAEAAMVAYRSGLRARVAAVLPAAELTRLRASAHLLAEQRAESQPEDGSDRRAAADE